MNGYMCVLVSCGESVILSHCIIVHLLFCEGCVLFGVL